MPERDQLLDMLRELRDAGVTPPSAGPLQARVSSAIAEEIERERRLRPAGVSGSAAERSGSDRFGAPRPGGGYERLARGLVPVVGLLVVGLVAAVFLGLRGSGSTSTSPSGGGAPRHGSVQLVYLAEPSAQAPSVTRAGLERTVAIIQRRLRASEIPGAEVSMSSANEITVVLPRVSGLPRAEQIVGSTAQLSFYDWEANAITPNGKTVASQLQIQDPTALEISQGSGVLSPGDPGAGSMNLYDAVKLAAKQPAAPFSKSLSRTGPAYYAFGAPGSAACAAAAKAANTVAAAGQHCLVSGPDDNLHDLESGLPAGVSLAETEVVTVPQGWVVLQAANLSANNQVAFASPAAQFFVLHDNVALTGKDITNPQQSTDEAGNPDVSFGFTGNGKNAFQDVTATIARRGELSSLGSETFNQHFAVALDNQLITVPSIDYRQYPDGITADNGADLTSALTIASARSLATELRLGALPLNLTLICGGGVATAKCPSPRLP